MRNWLCSSQYRAGRYSEAVIAVAERAEQLGYDSLWTIERLLYPVKLQRPLSRNRRRFAS